MRALDAMDGQRKPIWNFVEVGHPFTESNAPTITGPQIRAAVWHSIIAGARGIIYFNHTSAVPVSRNTFSATVAAQQFAPPSKRSTPRFSHWLVF